MESIDYNGGTYLYGEYCKDQDKLKLTFPTAGDYITHRKKEFAKEINPKVKALSNEALLFEALGLAGGDDYDGCFTDYGQVVYDELVKELKLRFLGTEEE